MVYCGYRKKLLADEEPTLETLDLSSLSISAVHQLFYMPMLYSTLRFFHYFFIFIYFLLVV